LIVSLAVNGANYLTGAASGDIHQWNGTAITGKPVKNHTSVVDAIAVTPTHIFTGGRDNKICVLDAKTMALLFPIDCNTFVDSVSCQPRAIAFAANQLYVGTFGSEIWKMGVNLATKKVVNPP
jgi:WD40 repeat protein